MSLVPLQFVPVFSTYQAAATSWQLPDVRSSGVQQVVFIFCICLSFLYILRVCRLPDCLRKLRSVLTQQRRVHGRRPARRENRRDASIHDSWRRASHHSTSRCVCASTVAALLQWLILDPVSRQPATASLRPALLVRARVATTRT